MQECPLTAAMDVHHCGEFFFRTLGKNVDGSHARWFAFEVANQITHMSEHAAVLLPLADELGFE
ncbi:MAG: hypothetical protein EXS25_09740 [Pedosphaera sp.]|nr:hypothetical protein [Pedosphaera sp.]